MKLNGLDLNKLNVFCSVVKHSGFKGASEELGLTRSAISQSIASLEGTLGKNLFNRVGNKIVVTEQARHFYSEILKYQGQLQDSVDILLGRSGAIDGVVRVGAYLEFTKSKLMPLVEDFLTRNTKAQIKFIFDSPSRLESLLEKNKIDLSISIFPHRNKKSIKTKKLYQEELVLIGHKTIVSEKPSMETLKELSVIDYFQSHLLYKRWWNTHFDQKLPKVFIRSYAATADMVLNLVRRKLGIGVVPKYILESTPGIEDLNIVQPTSKKLFDYLWLNETLESRSKSATHNAFALLLERAF